MRSSRNTRIWKWALFVMKWEKHWTNIWQYLRNLKSMILHFVAHSFFCRMIWSSHKNHSYSKKWRSDSNSNDSSWSRRNFKTNWQMSMLQLKNMRFVEISFSIKVESNVLNLNTFRFFNCLFFMKKRSFFNSSIDSSSWVFFLVCSCWEKKLNWYYVNERLNRIWKNIDSIDFWSDISNIDRSFSDISIKSDNLTLIRSFFNNNSNYFEKRAIIIISIVKTFTIWMKKVFWWKWKTLSNKFLRCMSI